MYVPRFNQMEDRQEIQALVNAVGSAELITVGEDGYPLATRLPIIWDTNRLIFHMARANPHWRAIKSRTPAMAVVTGSESYVSPSWYPTKREHGKVVPTWNYSAVQFTGRVEAHHDPRWLLAAVTSLTEKNESRRSLPWAVDDAPIEYIEQQLRAIVGVEFSIEKVEAKAKLSQNRSDEDFAGVISGLLSEGGTRDRLVAEAMQALRGSG